MWHIFHMLKKKSAQKPRSSGISVFRNKKEIKTFSDLKKKKKN